MKADQIEIVGTLRSRIKDLIALYEKEKRDKEKVAKERDRLVSQNSLQERQLIDIEHKFNTLKAAKLLLAGSDNGNDAKLKVNRIVREIDKCIALLNR